MKTITVKDNDEDQVHDDNDDDGDDYDGVVMVVNDHNRYGSDNDDDIYMYMISWFKHNAMDVESVVVHYLVFISDTTSEFLPGDNKDLLN